MKVINQSELEVLARGFNKWTGAVVQKIFASDQEFGVGLWTKDGLIWLWISLEKSLPIVVPLTELPLKINKKTTPVGLFLNAHIKGQIFTGAQVNAESGRVLMLAFGDRHIEVRLFSHGVNLLIFADKKKISFDKVKEVLPAQQIMPMGPVRTAEQITVEWLQARHSPEAEAPRKDKKSAVQKKQEAISKIEGDMSKRQIKPWRELGEWLKSHQSVEVPLEFKGLIDNRRSWTQNLENCFVEAKKNDEKMKRARARIEKLRNEIEHGEERPTAAKENVFRSTDAKGRTLRLSSATAFMGRSAQDNLKILRNANPWDYWLHLRERPSAHVIISMPKGHKIAEEEIKKVGEWLIRESFKKNYQGIAYEIIICECRHVKPIKGERAGRVHFHNERVLRLKVDT